MIKETHGRSWREEFSAWCDEHRFFGGKMKIDSAEKFGTTYLSLLKKWNDQINLMGPQELEVFWTRHWLDSLKGIFFLRTGVFIDFGSGGGFPGIPLAAFRSNVQTIFVEKVQKKRTFLAEATHDLGIQSRSKIVENLAEALNLCGDQEFELGMRAVSPSDLIESVKALKASPPCLEILYWGKTIDEQFPQQLGKLSRSRINYGAPHFDLTSVLYTQSEARLFRVDTGPSEDDE